MRVLIVEADTMLREFLDAILTKHGVHTLAAASPRDAAALLRQAVGPPDVALLELLLRGTTGIAYADALRTQHARMRMVFMAGGRDEEQLSIEAALVRGQLLHKPFTPQQLLDAIRVAA